MPTITLIDLAAVITLGVICWALRAVFIIAVPAERLPDSVARALQHLAPAALASIIAVELTAAIQHATLGAAGASVAIATFAAVVAFITRNMTWTVLAAVAGVAVLDLTVLPI